MDVSHGCDARTRQDSLQLRSRDQDEMRDRELLERIAGRDTLAMRDFYLLYQGRVHRLLARNGRRRELIDEMINDTFMVVWRKARGFRGESRVSTWVFGIAYRRQLMALRAETRAQRYTHMQPHEAADFYADSTDKTVTMDWIEQALMRLSPTQRAVVDFAYGLGLSCEEIASIMSCPVNTVKTRMLYARRRLRGALQELELPIQGRARVEYSIARQAGSREPLESGTTGARPEV